MMQITIDQKVKIQNAPNVFSEAIKTHLTFQNPKFLENQKMDRWNGNTPRLLKCYETHNGTLIIPRGFINQLISLCRRYDVRFVIQDNRRALPEVNFQFQGTLRPFQEQAVNDILDRDFGTLSAPTGSGKTVMALYVIAERKQPSLIVLHTKELLNQWIARIGTFLGIPAEQVGVIGNGKKEIGKRITVALVQTLYRCAEEVASHIGFLLVDEVHRAPSRTFTEAVTAFDSKYMLGLSATPWRRDGLSRLIYWHLGDVVYEIKKEGLIETGDILKADVITRETNFQTSYDPSEEYSKMLSELTQDAARNRLIASDIVKEACNGGGVCLVLSDRKVHCEAIQGLLRDNGIRSEVLTGDVSNKDREATIERLNEGLAKVVIATGALIGEGFDCPGLSTLFLTTPVKFNGRVIQYIGRILRPAPGKEKARAYDYVDSKIPVLVASSNARARVYESEFRE